jgi:hypothetical protein
MIHINPKVWGLGFMLVASTWTTAKGSTRRGVEFEMQLGPVNVAGSYSIKTTAENVKRPRQSKRQQRLPMYEHEGMQDGGRHG